MNDKKLKRLIDKRKRTKRKEEIKLFKETKKELRIVNKLIKRITNKAGSGFSKGYSKIHINQITKQHNRLIYKYADKVKHELIILCFVGNVWITRDTIQLSFITLEDSL